MSNRNEAIKDSVLKQWPRWKKIVFGGTGFVVVIAGLITSLCFLFQFVKNTVFPMAPSNITAELPNKIIENYPILIQKLLNKKKSENLTIETLTSIHQKEHENPTVHQKHLVLHRDDIFSWTNSNTAGHIVIDGKYSMSKNLPEPRCFQHKLKICNDIFNDSDIGLPNIFGDGSMIELIATFKLVESVIDSTCHESHKRLICSSLAPPCPRHKSARQSISRQLCRDVVLACKDHYLLLGKLNKVLNCAAYPDILNGHYPSPLKSDDPNRNENSTEND